MNDPIFQLAQVNIGRARGEMTDPVMAGFVNRLAEVNALADASPGCMALDRRRSVRAMAGMAGGRSERGDSRAGGSAGSPVANHRFDRGNCRCCGDGRRSRDREW